MATSTRNRTSNRAEIRMRLGAARVQTVRKPNVWVSPLTAGSPDLATRESDTRTNKKRGLFSKLGRGLRDAFFQIGLSGPSNLYYADGRGFPAGDKTLQYARNLGMMP